MNVLSFSFLVLVFSFFCTNHASLEIVAGLYHNCVYEPGQTGMMCWGLNAFGQLGYEDTNYRGDNAGEMSANLSIVNLGPDFVVNTTSLGGWHSCAASQEHAFKCWGSGGYYQLGHATNNDLGDGAGEMGVNLAFVEFRAGFVPLNVAAGLWHSCVLSTDALVVCFGSNEFGQCGAGTSDSNIIGPPSNIADVDLGSDFTPIDIATFWDHVCALSQQQSIKCFGDNLYGQLGYGDTTNRGLTPQSLGDGLLVVGLGSNFIPKAVAVGGGHTCALSTLKTVKCFGENIYGQCGQVTPGGTTAYIGDEANEMDDSLPVIVFPDGFVPIQMALGLFHTCILSESAQVVCFGRNHIGQLGLGHTTSTTSPTLVDLGTGFIPRKLAAGAYHTCAVSTVDTVTCWGSNNYGQLGLGHANNMGDEPNEMGDNLHIVDVLFTAENPTTSTPTTAAPTTAAPTGAPTAAPSTATPTTTAPTTAAPTTDDKDEDDAQSPETTAWSWGIPVAVSLGVCVCVCCVAGALRGVYVRRQRRLSENVAKAQFEEEAAQQEARNEIDNDAEVRVVPPGVVTYARENAHVEDTRGEDNLSLPAQESVLSVDASRRVNIELAMAEVRVVHPRVFAHAQENALVEDTRGEDNLSLPAQESVLCVDEGVVLARNQERRQSQQHDGGAATLQTAVPTSGATAGIDPSLGVYELNLMVDL